MTNRSVPLVAVLCALLALPLFAPTKSLAEITVTAKENADGSTTFSLSGTSEQDMPVSTVVNPITNYSVENNTYAPPSAGLFFQTNLPEGLSIEFTHPGGSQKYDLEQYLSVGPLWFLSGTGNLQTTAGLLQVTGRGTVTIPRFPFFVMVPGTYRINAFEQGVPSLPEESDVPEFPGFQPFTMLYKVIPFDRDPSISGKSPGTIKLASGSKASGIIQITNTGNVPLGNLVLNETSRDFKLGKPAKTSLDPGQSTTCPISFSGKRNSSVKVTITANNFILAYRGEGGEEEGSEVAEGGQPLPDFVPGEVVRATVKVRGEVGAAVRAPRNPARLLQGK